MNSPRVKLILAMSIDGRIAINNNESISIGGKGDKKILEEALAWSDATLVGRRTLDIHKKICLINNTNLIKKRLNLKRPQQPITIVVSNKNYLLKELPFFKQPIERWLLTSKISIENYNFDKQIKLQNNWNKTLDLLNQKGLSKLLVLGGGTLAGSLIQEDVIDELQITLTPKIIGGPHLWIPTILKDIPYYLGKKDSWIIKDHKCLEDNDMMICYTRNKSKSKDSNN